MTEENICPSCHRPLPPDAPGGLCPACVLMGAREDVPLPGMPDLNQVRAAFPQFEILECIGRGGMGAVYKARQPQLDRMVALKILLPGLERDPGFAERFAREARALAKLNHPNIVAVHDFGEGGGFFWLTMEYVDGVNLRQAMQAARFTPAQALAIIPELCSALQYAHDHGILHRDIKPENILLDARGKVKVADFGIARMAGDERLNPTLTMTGAALGTAAYVAPEQIENPRAVDHRADLYSLGVVLYEMLTGELPLGRFPAPSERSAIDPRLDEVVFRSLEKQPEKRYQQSEEFSNRVSGVAAAAPAVVQEPSSPLPGATPAMAVTGAAVTAFSLLFGGVLTYYLNSRVTYDSVVFRVVLIIVVGIPALAGMLLGAVAWVRIRESEHGLRGLRLAQFATLAWPVLAAILLTKIVLPVVIIYGIGRGWWALWKTRKAPGRVTGRAVLMFFVVWLPLLIAGLTTAFNLADEPPLRELAGKGGFIAKTLLFYLVTFIIAALAFGLTAQRAGMSRMRRVCAGISVLLALASIGVAKRYDGHWPAAHYLGSGTFAMPEPFPWKGATPSSTDTTALIPYYSQGGEHRTTPVFLSESMPAMKSPFPEAIRLAAGDYADRIAISYDVHPSSNYAQSPRLYLMTRTAGEWLPLWESFTRRLEVALPAETAIKMRTTWSLHGADGQRRVYSFRHFEVSSGILVAGVLSAILAAWCLFPLASLPVGLALLAGVAAYLMPLWPDPEIDRLLIAGPPLPPLAPRVAVTDFSTPVAAARTVFEAAWAGDLELVKRGICKRWRAKIDGRDAWEVALRHLGQRTAVKSYRDEFPEPERDRIYAETASSGGPLNMILEDGEWRLDDMPFDL